MAVATTGRRRSARRLPPFFFWPLSLIGEVHCRLIAAPLEFTIRRKPKPTDDVTPGLLESIHRTNLS
jgi:hypothetical protein